MTRADVRVEIAEALDAVDGLHGYVRRPATARIGDGWPLWRGATLSQGRLLDTFAVWIALSPDEADADTMVDSQELLDAMDALMPIIYVTGVEPVAIQSEAGDLLGLMITGTKEIQ